jgi:threonine aldolase
MARLLKLELIRIPQIKIMHEVQANGVFAQIPEGAIAKIQERYFFYVWDESKSVVRWMCSFDTTEEDVLEFSRVVRQAVAE